MSELDFFSSSVAMSLGALADAAPAALPEGADAGRRLRLLASLDRAGPDDLSFHIEDLALDGLIGTRAGACLVSARHHAAVPSHTIALVTADPEEAFRRIAGLLPVSVGLPLATSSSAAARSAAAVHGDARLEQGVFVASGCIIGPGVEIGAGTQVGANTVIDAGVRIGRNCFIDAQVSIRHTLIGNGVCVHAGARIGPGGTGDGRSSSSIMPRLGRVIIQDDVEIGPNAVIECGFVRDTVIGDHARIGPLVFIEGGRMVDRHASVEAVAFSSGAKMV